MTPESGVRDYLPSVRPKVNLPEPDTESKSILRVVNESRAVVLLNQILSVNDSKLAPAVIRRLIFKYRRCIYFILCINVILRIHNV